MKNLYLLLFVLVLGSCALLGFAGVISGNMAAAANAQADIERERSNQLQSVERLSDSLWDKAVAFGRAAVEVGLVGALLYVWLRKRLAKRAPQPAQFRRRPRVEVLDDEPPPALPAPQPQVDISQVTQVLVLKVLQDLAKGNRE